MKMRDPKDCSHGEAEVRLGRDGGAYCRLCGTFARFANPAPEAPPVGLDAIYYDVELMRAALHEQGIGCKPNVIHCRSTHKGHANRIVSSLHALARPHRRDGLGVSATIAKAGYDQRVVTAKKDHRCWDCDGVIVSGDRYLAYLATPGHDMNPTRNWFRAAFHRRCSESAPEWQGEPA